MRASAFWASKRFFLFLNLFDSQRGFSVFAMSAAAVARLTKMRGAPTPKSRAVAAAASRLTTAIRRQNVRLGLRTTRTRRRNAATAGYLGIELKYFDQYFPATTLDAAATPGNTFRCDPATQLSLVAVSTGAGPTNRDGKKIRCRSLYIKGTVFRPAYKGYSQPQEPMSAYVAVVLDRQCNASQLAPAQVFTNPAGTAIGNTCLLRNLEYSDRYRILRDQVFLLPGGPMANNAAADTFSSSGVIRHFEWYIPLNFDILFNTVTPSAATVASIVSNNVGVIACATINGVNCTAALAYTSRLRFVG